jgi:hypothetical protein
MSTPVSLLVIEPGRHVESADGQDDGKPDRAGFEALG